MTNNLVDTGCGPFRWSHDLSDQNVLALVYQELCKNMVGHWNTFWLCMIPHEQIATCMATMCVIDTN